MANESGREAIKLIEPFIANGHRYGFYQAIRWLKNMSNRLQGMGYQPLRLKVLPRLSLDFIGNDISDVIYHSESHTVEIVVTFLALYGTASPLPTFYTEDLMFELSEDITVGKDFLDIFHQILYQKLYDVWLKYKLNQCVFEHKKKSYINKLYHLIGLGDQTLRKMVPNAKSLIKYVGLLNQQPRSAKSLETLLKDYFEVPINVISAYCSIETIEKPQQLRLGLANHSLGKETYIGQKVKSASFSIGIKIENLSYEKFNLFSYQQPYAKALAFLINFFANAPIKCFVSISLKQDCVNNLTLSNYNWSKLGQNTWLGVKGKKTYQSSYQIG
ncbi:type VI secretion system baseplate subunit TssG [Thiotrichales bacterium 19S3-7]|nr:type VI secretion system baseplate subunit TssG [Thiotrichales bacterium 19S3-7]MCF6802141.1 type VI secretion system baseplate subunit TssG [Thiotrichales bacterium 19S3-11]